MSEEILQEAWELRKKGAYTMREIADKLGVDRYELIDALQEYIKNKEKKL